MKQELQRIYLKYKKQVVPTIIVSAILFILLRIIFPQLGEISEKEQEIELLITENENLQHTVNTLTNFNSAGAEQDIDLVTSALPTSKDISIIFSAITEIAAEAQVNVTDFSLTVGGLYGRAIEGANIKGVPSLDVTVRFESADPRNYILLAEIIQRKLPLVEIKSIDTASSRGLFELSFFYKPIDLTLLSKNAIVKPLSQAEMNTLTQLREWNQ